MFDIEDVQIETAYSIGMALLCVVYGVMKWNREED
jgi:hypothetical protein